MCQWRKKALKKELHCDFARVGRPRKPLRTKGTQSSYVLWAETGRMQVPSQQVPAQIGRGDQGLPPMLGNCQVTAIPRRKRRGNFGLIQKKPKLTDLTWIHLSAINVSKQNGAEFFKNAEFVVPEWSLHRASLSIINNRVQLSDRDSKSSI